MSLPLPPFFDPRPRAASTACPTRSARREARALGGGARDRARPREDAPAHGAAPDRRAEHLLPSGVRAVRRAAARAAGAVEDCARHRGLPLPQPRPHHAGGGDARHAHGRADLPPALLGGRRAARTRRRTRDHPRRRGGGRWRVNPALAPAVPARGLRRRRPGAGTTRAGSPRAASTRSSCGRTTRWWAGSATRWSRRWRRPSSSTRSRGSRRRGSRSRAGTRSPRTTPCSRPEVTEDAAGSPIAAREPRARRAPALVRRP